MRLRRISRCWGVRVNSVGGLNQVSKPTVKRLEFRYSLEAGSPK